LEDFTQDALLRVLAQLDRFGGRSKFTTWAHAHCREYRLYRIATQTLAGGFNRRSHRRGQKLHEPESMPDNAAGDDEERGRLIAALRRAVGELTDKQRAVILGELRDLPFDQISKLLGMKRNAPYKLVRDARVALKRHQAAVGISAEDIPPSEITHLTTN